MKRNTLFYQRAGFVAQSNISPEGAPPLLAMWRKPHISVGQSQVRNWQILLQKSKVASVQISGKIPKQEAINDSYNLGRVTEVAYEFSEKRWVPQISTRKTHERPPEF
jgi:hypothetical protein